MPRNMTASDSVIELIRPDWPAPDNVRACCTTRAGGVSEGAFSSLNLATHVGDRPEHVEQNRQRLRQHAGLPAEPVWLAQCHGNRVVELTARSQHDVPQADAAHSREAGVVCAVLTADCLPVLMCDHDGGQVAAIHAGWRGLHAGVISNAVQQFDCSPHELLVWLGPAIGPQAFEVGEDVYAAFVAKSRANQSAFESGGDQRWQCDLYHLARLELQALGTGAIYGGQWCTHSDASRFYSFRLDGETGRMASLIWR